jgi:hypothetical protein
MKLAPLLLLIGIAFSSAAEESTFRTVQFPSAKGSLASASLTFNDADKQVEVRVSDGRAFTVPYGQIGKISYEYTKKHRLKQGVGIAMLSPGTGAIVALTKSKNHWLEFDFNDQNTPKVLIVKLDKKDYQKVCDAAKAHTGKDVEVLGKTTTQSLKAKLN